MLETYSNIPAYEQAEFSDKGRVTNTGPGKLIWAGKVAPPAIGEKIKITMNGLGEAAVVGYFSQEGFLGLLTQLDNPPAWYVKQNGGNVVGHIFGPEFALLPTKPAGPFFVTYQSVDGSRRKRKFKTIARARKFAVSWVGENPEFGSSYAVSGDGIGKVTVSGATLKQLFGKDC